MFLDPDGALARRASRMGSQIMENWTVERFQYPEWQKPCQDALVELDKDKLRERIATAEAAIVSRLRATSAGSVSAQESQAIEDARAILRVLERVCLGPTNGIPGEHRRGLPYD